MHKSDLVILAGRPGMGKTSLATNMAFSAAKRFVQDQEDGIEKLPLTPGPIIPAREQLGDLLLATHRPKEALEAYRVALASAPARRGALSGAAQAADAVGDTQTAGQMRALLAK